MIVYLLTMCTINSGIHCLPAQEFRTKEVCLAVAKSYEKMTYDLVDKRYQPARATCISVKRAAQ